MRHAALAAAVLVALALPLYVPEGPARETVAAAAVARYGALATSELSVIRSENPEEIVAHLVREAGGHLHPMGYDFSAMGLRPAAGAIQEIHGAKVLVVIYRGEAGTLICYTFAGSEADAPVHAAKFSDPAKPMNFYAFSQGPVNAVLHREGELICILASEMPMEKLLALAQAKARPA